MAYFSLITKYILLPIPDKSVFYGKFSSLYSYMMIFYFSSQNTGMMEVVRNYSV